MHTGVFRGLAQPQLSRLREDLALLEYSDPGAVRARMSTNGFALLTDKRCVAVRHGHRGIAAPDQSALQPRLLAAWSRALSPPHCGARWRRAGHFARIRRARVSASPRRQASTSNGRGHCVRRSRWAPADDRLWCRSRTPSWTHGWLDWPIPTKLCQEGGTTLATGSSGQPGQHTVQLDVKRNGCSNAERKFTEAPLSN